MKRIIRYLKPYLGTLVGAILLVSVSTFCDLLLPRFMSDILNKGLQQGGEFTYILRLCGGMFLVAGISLTCILLGTRLSARLVACFCADLREDIFRKVNTLSFEEFGKLGTAALVTRATHDVGTVSWVASMLAGTVATIPMLFIGGVALSMEKDVVLSLILLAFIPIILGVVVLVGKRVLPLWEESDRYIDKQNGIMRERLRGIRVIRAFNAEDREHRRIDEATHVMAENIIRGNVSMGILTPLSLLFLNVAVVLIVYLGGWRMEQGVSAVSAGDIFAIIQYVTMVMNGVIMASFAVVMYPHAQVAANRIGEIFSGAEHSQTDGAATKTAALQGGIRLEQVSFSYGGEEYALKDISLTIRPGEKIALIGGTGSGKSTLISLLLGFRQPTQGEIYFDDIPARELERGSLRQQISSVLQGSAIYSGTVGENIRMGNPEADTQALWEAAKIAQVSDFIASCEGGMEYEIRQGGKNLSGGQKQRLSIARAIVKKAPIYIFDDSFSALDFLTEKKLRGALNESIRGCTQIVVTQRVTSAMRSDCIFVMDHGRLVDQGRHEELLERCALYREIYASQTGGDLQ